jgi:hypothetical protein
LLQAILTHQSIIQFMLPIKALRRAHILALLLVVNSSSSSSAFTHFQTANTPNAPTALYYEQIRTTSNIAPPAAAAAASSKEEDMKLTRQVITKFEDRQELRNWEHRKMTNKKDRSKLRRWKERALADKYARIESVQDRAFQILVDLEWDKRFIDRIKK